MDVCFLTPSVADVWYGPQIESVAAALRRRGCRVLRRSAAGGCKHEIDRDPGGVAWLRWVRRLRELRPDVIHLWSRRPRASLLAAIAAVGSPQVVISHRGSPGAPALCATRRLSPGWRWMRHGPGGFADGVARPVAEFDRAAVRRGWGVPVDARVVLVAADGDFSGDLDAVWLAAQFAVADDDLYVVVGSATEPIRPRRMQRRLEVYARRAEVDGRIAWVGGSPAELVAGADAVCQFGRRDASATLLAAAAARRPLVAVDTPTSRALIDDGRTGWLIRPHNVTDATRRLLRLSEEPGLAERFTAAAAERMGERHGMSTVVSRYLSLYDGLGASRTSTLRPACEAAA